MKLKSLSNILKDAGFSYRKIDFTEYWSLSNILLCVKTQKNGEAKLINVVDNDWGYVKYIQSVRCSSISVFVIWRTGEEWYLAR